jgi:hypothetical protein
VVGGYSGTSLQLPSPSAKDIHRINCAGQHERQNAKSMHNLRRAGGSMDKGKDLLSANESKIGLRGKQHAVARATPSRIVSFAMWRGIGGKRVLRRFFFTKSKNSHMRTARETFNHSSRIE